MTIEKQVFSVNDVQVTATLAPRKPLIIVTRMASGAAGIWDTIWEDCARYFSIANFDLLSLPAMKSLDQPREMFRQMGNTCVEVAQGLGFGTFHIFGWGGGSQIAMRCAIDFPELVQSCILLEPSHGASELPSWQKGQEVSRALLECHDRTLYTYHWFMTGLTADYINSHWPDLERMVAERVAKDRLVQGDNGRLLKWNKAIGGAWISDAEMGRIKAPTLIAVTQMGGSTPKAAMARRLHSLIPSSGLVIIENLGRLFLIEDPGRWRAVSEPFMRLVTGATSSA